MLFTVPCLYQAFSFNLNSDFPAVMNKDLWLPRMKEKPKTSERLWHVLESVHMSIMLSTSNLK